MRKALPILLLAFAIAIPLFQINTIVWSSSRKSIGLPPVVEAVIPSGDTDEILNCELRIKPVGVLLLLGAPMLLGFLAGILWNRRAEISPPTGRCS